MIAFVATVVACTTKPTCGASTSASASARSTACMKPSDGSAGVLAAEGAPRPEAVAVGEDRVRRRAVEDVVLPQPEAASEAARAFRVRHEREAADPHRVIELGLLDRRVLGVLAVCLYGVRAVAAPPSAVAAGERLVEAGVRAGVDIEAAEACRPH